MSAAPAIRLKGTGRIDGQILFGPLTLELPGGEWTCLLGPSGAGKSTLLRLIAGLETGIRFSGETAASDGLPLDGRVAYMAQDDLLLPWLDAAGNIALGARLRGEKPDAARRAELVGRLELAPHASKRPAALSGGQRQRVALARTLMEERPVVLLDEPFSALDARLRAEMQELAAETLRGRTVLMVTHDPAEAARLGQRIYLMEGAELARIPPPAAAIPRAGDDVEFLRFQAGLLARLRRAA